MKQRRCLPLVLVLGWVALLSSCLVGELSGIPCGDDDDCPGAAFCDIPASTCRFLADGPGPPDLRVSGVRDLSGVSVTSVRVPGSVESTLDLEVVNEGACGAVDVVLELIPLACMHLAFDLKDVPTTIAPAATVEIPFTIMPEDCNSPAIQDWFLFYSGRATRGTFNILPDISGP